MKTLQRGRTNDDIQNPRKGTTERRWFFRFAEFGNYVLGFGGSTKKSDSVVSFSGGYIVPAWLIAVEKSQVEKMDCENCPDYVADIVIKKFLSLSDNEVVVSIIYDRTLLYYAADEETHELVVRKAKRALS